MAGAEKRIPGQSNADYGRAQSDPNANFLGTQSLEGRGDLTWIIGAFGALAAWRKRRKRVKR